MKTFTASSSARPFFDQGAARHGESWGRRGVLDVAAPLLCSRIAWRAGASVRYKPPAQPFALQFAARRRVDQISWLQQVHSCSSPLCSPLPLLLFAAIFSIPSALDFVCVQPSSTTLFGVPSPRPTPQGRRAQQHRTMPEREIRVLRKATPRTWRLLWQAY